MFIPENMRHSKPVTPSKFGTTTTPMLLRPCNNSALPNPLMAATPVTCPLSMTPLKKTWYAEHPLGHVEHRLAWQKGGELFEWVATHNAIIRINDILFLHGGLSANLLPLSIRDINTRLRAELNREPFEGDPLGSADYGPLVVSGSGNG